MAHLHRRQMSSPSFTPPPPPPSTSSLTSSSSGIRSHFHQYYDLKRVTTLFECKVKIGGVGKRPNWVNNSFKEIQFPMDAAVVETCLDLGAGIKMERMCTNGRVVKFPIRFNDLHENAVMYFDIWDVCCDEEGNSCKIRIGHCDVKLIGEDGKIKSGSYVLKISNSTSLEPDELKRIEKSITKSSHQWINQHTIGYLRDKREKICIENDLTLFLEFQVFTHPIVVPSIFKAFEDSKFSQQEKHVHQRSTSMDSLVSRSSTNKKLKAPIEDFESNHSLINDPEIIQKNPAEEKYMKMSLHHTSVFDIKPNPGQKKLLDMILQLSPLKSPNDEQIQALWKYRYYLMNDPRGLTKFLRMVEWSNPKEATEARKMMGIWVEIDPFASIELLSRFFQGITAVRSYAVKILRKGSDEDILDILLQLVQALRYEPDMTNSDLAKFLLERAASNFRICNKLKWYLKVEETQGTKYSGDYARTRRKLIVHLKKEAKKNDNQCNLFVEKLFRQEELMEKLDILTKSLKSFKDRQKKIQQLKQFCKDPKQEWDRIFFNNISKKLPPSYIPLPICPAIEATGLREDEGYVFKSAMNPVLLSFSINQTDEALVHADEGCFRVIYKSGDDLRQDQLVIQIITLMDKLLKRNGLDMKLIPYKVLATAHDSGFVECISPNKALSEIIQISNKDINKWLRDVNSTDQAYEEACKNFVYSCAGYSVITYILGVGDRHLDNILMKPTGQLFHIDFGYILGRDPKPFPPPIKLCKEMVTALKSMKVGSRRGYDKFIELCCTSFNIIRRYSKLILNMFTLMADAHIPDIEFGGSDIIKNISKIEDKLIIDQNDGQAIKHMKNIIQESERALFPVFTEKIHAIAQKYRS